MYIVTEVHVENFYLFNISIHIGYEICNCAASIMDHVANRMSEMTNKFQDVNDVGLSPEKM